LNIWTHLATQGKRQSSVHLGRTLDCWGHGDRWWQHQPDIGPAGMDRYGRQVNVGHGTPITGKRRFQGSTHVAHVIYWLCIGCHMDQMIWRWGECS